MALNFPSSPTLGQVYTDTTSGFSYEWTGVVWKSFTAANASTIKSLDDISASFNGSTQTFALTSSGIAVYPISDQQLIVNLGGIVQDPVNDYNVSGSNITFTTAPTSGLTFSATLLGVGVPIDYANSGNVYERQLYTATAGQTTFTFTAGYTPGYLDVYRNGVRLASGTDFTATNGTSFVLTTPALLNDEVEAIGYKVKTIVTTEGDVVNLNVTGIATISPSTFINNTGINVAGVVTATSFSGPLTGNVTGNLTGTASNATLATNAQGLTGNPSITVTNATVNGVLSVGGTTVILNAATLQINDRDITLGVTTDALGNNVANDITANHGGISIASTVGTPLINIPIDGVNSDLPTNKQIMWVKKDHYTGLGTDTWIFNYGVSIGNTSNVQNGSRLTVGTGFTVYSSYVDTQDIRTSNINSVGVITANDYDGNFILDSYLFN